jgi:opacity protein-like surface antigen
MRKLVAALLVLATTSATAQQTAQPPVAAASAGAGWQKVQALAAGTSIKVKTRTGNATCTLKGVDAGALTCNHGKDIVIQQADILTIRVAHRGRSALVGLAIGGGGGAIVGAASIPSCSGICIISRSTGAVVVGVAGALIGAIVGVTTDFTHTTVYKAP